MSDFSHRGRLMRHLPLLPAWLRRRWSVLLASPLIAAAVAGVLASSEPTSYTSTTTAVVSAGETAEAPGSSFEATALATTYARLISEDDRLADYVADRADMDPADVRGGIDVVQVTGTAILQISITADNEADAVQASQAVVSALQSRAPIARAIPPRVMRVARTSEVTVNSGTSPTTVIGIGGVFGLLLGFGLALLLERVDVRVDSRRAAAVLLGCPVRDWPAAADNGVLLAMLTRWAELAGDESQTGQSRTVALVPTDRSSKAQVLRIRAA